MMFVVLKTVRQLGTLKPLLLILFFYFFKVMKIRYN